MARVLALEDLGSNHGLPLPAFVILTNLFFLSELQFLYLQNRVNIYSLELLNVMLRYKLYFRCIKLPMKIFE